MNRIERPNVVGIDFRRVDRRLRWIAVGTLVLLTQAAAAIRLGHRHFFDPWLFAMLAAPALGVEPPESSPVNSSRPRYSP